MLGCTLFYDHELTNYETQNVLENEVLIPRFPDFRFPFHKIDIMIETLAILYQKVNFLDRSTHTNLPVKAPRFVRGCAYYFKAIFS